MGIIWAENWLGMGWVGPGLVWEWVDIVLPRTGLGMCSAECALGTGWSVHGLIWTRAGLSMV
jgi:hypothetical protein